MSTPDLLLLTIVGSIMLDSFASFVRRHLLLAVVISLSLVFTLIIISFPQTKWRAQIVLLKATGQVPDIEWGDLSVFLLPGPESQGLERMVSTLNPYGIIRNPVGSPSDLKAGAEVFMLKCANCHSPDARGGAAAPALVGRDFTHGASDWAIFRTIRYGLPGTAMPAHALPSLQIWQLLAHLRNINAPAQVENVNPLTNKLANVNVLYDEIKDPAQPANDWLTYSGSYSGIRHSSLKQIKPDNVNQLALKWIHQFDDVTVKIETSPIVRDGIMYLTSSTGQVLALNAATGDEIWSFKGDYAGGPNRGVAILNDKIFVGTSDARLIALYAATGMVAWQTNIAKDSDEFGISAAPLVYRDMVVTGVFEKGAIGFIAAYDANTGQERWRFQTIPGPNEPGHDTWAGDSWRTGGAPTWLTGSYDPDQDLLYWGVGNPKPDYDTSSRTGDNLYSNSVVVLQGSTGKLIWHFQFTPGDDHDWDSNQIPMLVDKPTDHGQQKQLLFANRNGFYYVLDRTTGKFIKASPYVHQNWADGIDANGRPILHAHDPSENSKGILMYPGNGGGTNWWSPSYDPQLHMVYVPVVEKGMLFFPSTGNHASAKNFPRDAGPTNFYTAIRALNSSDGNRVWEYRFKPRDDHADMGGILTTQTGVLFAGDLGVFVALDSYTGKKLWSAETGGVIHSAPITYTANDEQFVVVTAGKILTAFALH